MPWPQRSLSEWLACCWPKVSRIIAVVLVAAHLVAVTVLWGELGGTANSDEFHPVLGYWALALAGLWALIGALTAGEHSD